MGAISLVAPLCTLTSALWLLGGRANDCHDGEGGDEGDSKGDNDGSNR